MLEALEASGPASFLRTSFLAYPLLNALHVLSIGALVTSAALMDLRILGWVWRSLPVETVVGLLRPVAIGALLLAAMTGALLFSVQPFDYLDNPAFRIKLVLLAGAVLNALLFTVFRLHLDASRGVVQALAALSLILWIAVAGAGRFIGFLQ